MGAAAVLADEDAEKILEAHVLEPLRRLHHHMMALAAQHAADHQDHLGVGLTPQARRIASMRSRVTSAGSKRSKSMLHGTTAMRSHGVP